MIFGWSGQQSFQVLFTRQMKSSLMQRNVRELPNLKRFRMFCFVCVIGLLAGLLILEVIDVVPRIEWLINKAVLLTAIATFYFLTIGLRTQVIIYQLSRSHRQIFDRPAPEWISVCFLLCGLVIVFWPHSQ